MDQASISDYRLGTCLKALFVRNRQIYSNSEKLRFRAAGQLLGNLGERLFTIRTRDSSVLEFCQLTARSRVTPQDLIR